ncbi:MAG: c-type cytochrome [Spirochaetota bacterium]|nr:c-type cytochrome [Spirochaetota bacterium]
MKRNGSRLHKSLNYILLSFSTILLFFLFQVFLTAEEENKPQANNEIASNASKDKLERGESIFANNCQHCHSIGGKKVGPDLKNVHLRRKKSWLKQWIKSPLAVITSGDKAALKLKKNYDKVMPDQLLTEGQIEDVLYFIEDSSRRGRVVSQPDGAAIFRERCISCHTVGDQKVGSDLKGINKNRSEEWLINWIRSPRGMINKKDPIALKLAEKYKGQKVEVMPPQDLSVIEIRSVLDYIAETTARNDLITTATLRKETSASSFVDPGMKAGLDLAFSHIECIGLFLLIILMGIIIVVGLKKDVKKRVTILIFVTFAGFTAVAGYMEISNLGIHQGYEPSQPIAFSHKLHAGDKNIACLYCHFGAEKSRHAGIPPVNVCMNCHSVIKKTQKAKPAELVDYHGEKVSKELVKIYKAIESGKSIKWVKVHNMQDFVYFNHSQHLMVAGRNIIGKEIEDNNDVKKLCGACHGKIDTMEKVAQDAPLTMGWCIKCHRQTISPSHHNKTVAELGGIDCARCHY